LRIVPQITSMDLIPFCFSLWFSVAFATYQRVASVVLCVNDFII
jgi:hypothetical protein